MRFEFEVDYLKADWFHLYTNSGEKVKLKCKVYLINGRMWWVASHFFLLPLFHFSLVGCALWWMVSFRSWIEKEDLQRIASLQKEFWYRWNATRLYSLIDDLINIRMFVVLVFFLESCDILVHKRTIKYNKISIFYNLSWWREILF